MFTVKLLGLFIIFEGNILNTHASKIDVDCYNKDNNGSTYIGTVNIASNNQTCLNWRTVSSPYVTYDKNNAFCRNPNGFKKPWCYTGAGFQFSYCNISVCDVDCYNTNDNGSSYVGTVHTSRLNHPCLNWLTVNSLLVPYHENHTYCRNPNGFGEPWCYTGTLNNGFENCDVQMCGSCESSPCHEASTCVKQVHGFKCTCAAGYTGALCSSNIDDCASNPCQHNSTCIDLVGGYMCSCGPGLTGVHCENDVNECANNPCQYGGTCHNKFNSYTCSCAPGFVGENCIGDIDECISDPCQNRGTCINLLNGYRCLCLNGDTGVHCEMRNEIVIPPSIILSAERSIQEGIGRFVLPCFAEGIPLPKVKWESIEAKLQSNIKQVDHYLVIKNVTIADSGYYMCTATNRGGTDIKIVHINVNANHQVHVTPRITAPFEVEVNYYANAKLVCNVTGYPTPRIQWKFANKTLPSTSSTLTLLRATNETAGIYTCIATNDVGTSKADIKLKVTFDTPKIVSPPLTTVCKAGASHNFTCIATGNPSPEISWSFTSFIHHSSGLPRNVKFNNDTVIQLVSLQESGVLACTATNEFGTDYKSANVIVRHDPDVIG
ncbi:uncharacterized protein LOC143076840 [Mytilus galloprovincialis]|uniref:uncharacterized protein LOC143076840 n=1 Tax=Mytilus galloprovincialis TaxID=29158 RepID=UPI003F7CAEDB